MIRTKSGAAALSIASNSLLIALKLAAGAITGSIAILTEAVHSLIDLVASVIAFVSVRKADEPADAEHPYGHEKVENLAAAIEGMLILVGAGIIVYEATHRLVVGGRGRAPRRRHRGDRLLGGRQPRRLRLSSRQARASTDSPALEGDAAHLRTDALTSVGVLVGLVLVADHRRRRLRLDRRAGRRRRDRRSPGSGSSAAPRGCWSTRRRRRRSSTGSRRRSPAPAPPEVAGYHKLRARRAGRRRYIDLHVQFRSGTTPRARPRARPRDCATRSRPSSRDAEVLIHVEPEGSFRDPGSQRRRAVPGRLSAARA